MHPCEHAPMLIPNLYSKTTLSRLLNIDSRTASNRLKKLNVLPAAVLGYGRELFDENALNKLRLDTALLSSTASAH
jgi:hypothetical protein